MKSSTKQKRLSFLFTILTKLNLVLLCHFLARDRKSKKTKQEENSSFLGGGDGIMKLTICKKNKIVYLTVFGLLLYICGFGTASETLDKSQTKKKSRGWLVADFPSPTEQGMSIVDPDGILSLQHRDALSNRLDAVDLVVNVDDLDVPVQMAVVVVEKVCTKNTQMR